MRIPFQIGFSLPLSFLLLVVLGNSGWGARVVTLPPLTLFTVHGAYIDTNRHCVSANVTRNSDSISGPVSSGFHHYLVNCQDASIPARSQTLRFTVLGSSTVEGIHNNGLGLPGQGGPTVTIPPLVVNPRPFVMTLPAGGRVQYLVRGMCSQLGCTMADNLGIISGVTGNHQTAPGQLCLGVRTRVVIRIEVVETLGDVTCSVSTRRHRTSGIRDLPHSTPPIYYVFGGKAF